MLCALSGMGHSRSQFSFFYQPYTYSNYYYYYNYQCCTYYYYYL